MRSIRSRRVLGMTIIAMLASMVSPLANAAVAPYSSGYTYGDGTAVADAATGDMAVTSSASSNQQFGNHIPFELTADSDGAYSVITQNFAVVTGTVTVVATFNISNLVITTTQPPGSNQIIIGGPAGIGEKELGPEVYANSDNRADSKAKVNLHLNFEPTDYNFNGYDKDPGGDCNIAEASATGTANYCSQLFSQLTATQSIVASQPGTVTAVWTIIAESVCNGIATADTRFAGNLASLVAS